MYKAANSPEFRWAEQTWHCSWNCLEHNFPSFRFSLTISLPFFPCSPWFIVSHLALQGSSRAIIWSGIHKWKPLWYILCASFVFSVSSSLAAINFFFFSTQQKSQKKESCLKKWPALTVYNSNSSTNIVYWPLNTTFCWESMNSKSSHSN